MARETTRIEALAIDYLHRCGGEGEKQAVIDYLESVHGYSPTSARVALEHLADDGLLDSQRGGGGRSSLYSVNYGTFDGDDGV